MEDTREDSQNCFPRPVVPDQFYPIEKMQEYVHLGVVKDYAKGSAVVLPRESTLRMIYVLSGRLRVNMVTDDGREKLLYTAGPYSLLGRLFSTKVNDFHIIALADSTVCFFTKQQLKEVFRRDEELIFEILKNYTSKVAYFMQKTKDLESYTPTIRILRLLDDLCHKQGELVEDIYEISTVLSQNNIAEITGAHYVTVSKVLGCLRKQGIARKTKNKIYIYDWEGLKKLIAESIYE